MSASTSPTAAPGSPPVPALAAKMKAKRRTMTLVNPADPDDFSTDSIPSSSSNQSLERRTREVTPVNMVPVQQYTPLGVAEYGVKGILRSAGTPGSGNGVRFYPKNRFRVITPREELAGPSTPQKKPNAPAPASTSFFSQLLSVVPTMSPRRAPPVEVIPESEPDESWETPGEEGEISLVASSVHSFDRSTILEEEEGEGEEGQSLEVPWTGPAEVHSSPLFIAMEGSSRDISVQDIGTPAPEVSMDDWKLRLNAQEDVSNLLSTSLPEYGEASFSIGSMAGPSFLPPRPASLSPPGSKKEDIGGSSWMQGEQSSLLSVNEDDNPTIRRKLSPVPSPPITTTSIRISPNNQRILSPLPTRSPKTKPFTSIFADMSAEQAELSWPLIRPPISGSNLKPNSKPVETFHSFADSPLPPRQTPIPATTITAKPLPSIKPHSTGNDTEFFDATASFFPLTPCPMKAAPGTSLQPNNYSGSLGRHTGLSALTEPTEALFQAHQNHTSAIQAELESYRQLSQILGEEVEERDKALAEMSLRLVESEMQAATLGTTEEDKISPGLKRKSLSPSPSPSPLTANSAGTKVDIRADQAEAEVRDLAIRLEKAQSEQRALAQEVMAAKQSYLDANQEKLGLIAKLEKWEAKDKETAINKQHLQYQLQEAEKEITRLRGIEEDVHSIQDELSGMKRLRRADEEELDRLTGLLDNQKEGSKRKEEQLRQSISDIQAELEDVRRAKEDAERELNQERRSNEDLEVMVGELKLALHQTQIDLTQSTTDQTQTMTRLHADLTRLRAEVSDKDLEILNLQRRKSELKEDREMLNVALDSKQQEVELLKRKLSRSTATPLPLGTSQRQNLTPLPNATPAPISSTTLKLHPSTAVPTTVTQTREKRISSASYATPLASNGRTMRSGAVLKGSTVVKDRVMRKVSDQRENRAEEGKRQERGVSRRESVLA